MANKRWTSAEIEQRVKEIEAHRTERHYSRVCLLVDNDDLLSMIRQLREPQWIRVEERLPQDNVQVLVHGGIAVHYSQSGWWTRMEVPERPIEWRVTHWMPLPIPPNTRKQ